MHTQWREFRKIVKLKSLITFYFIVFFLKPVFYPVEPLQSRRLVPTPDQIFIYLLYSARPAAFCLGRRITQTFWYGEAVNSNIINEDRLEIKDKSAKKWPVEFIITSAPLIHTTPYELASLVHRSNDLSH